MPSGIDQLVAAARIHAGLPAGEATEHTEKGNAILELRRRLLKMEAASSPEARNLLNGVLGAIFAGSLIGTHIGKPIGGKPDDD